MGDLLRKQFKFFKRTFSENDRKRFHKKKPVSEPLILIVLCAPIWQGVRLKMQFYKSNFLFKKKPDRCDNLCWMVGGRKPVYYINIYYIYSGGQTRQRGFVSFIQNTSFIYLLKYCKLNNKI